MNTFLQGVVDPFSNGSPSPTYASLAAADQTVHMNGTFSTLASGAIVWLPHRSPNSAFVMAQLTTQTTPATSTYPPIIDCGNDGASGTTVQQIQVLPIQLSDPSNHGSDPYNFLVVPSSVARIRYSPGAIFEGQSTPLYGNGILSSPQQLASGIRPYNAMLQIKSDSEGDSSTKSGEMHAFSVSDIRDLRQLPVAKLSTLAVPKSDCVWAESAADGVCAFLGPDIPIDYVPFSGSTVCDNGNAPIAQTYSTGTVGIDGSRGVAFMAPGFGIINATGRPEVAPYDPVLYTLPDYPWYECVDYELFLDGPDGGLVGNNTIFNSAFTSAPIALTNSQQTATLNSGGATSFNPTFTPAPTVTVNVPDDNTVFVVTITPPAPPAPPPLLPPEPPPATTKTSQFTEAGRVNAPLAVNV